MEILNVLRSFFCLRGTPLSTSTMLPEEALRDNSDNRELKQITMTAATRTSPNKRFNEQNNSYARAL